ncbi:hypothetical protein LTR56_022449 [Elasticomyces elasticus]|nr:hypothetical protein LTR56_022449 [Elasticomyces elasticus]KAK3626812.1 hypothetical protein LTR22_023016 [Elasticomyces elasticus]KAK4905261.1 hypothetical protein LTR49_025411 [Elasticomyces elasticus]KAK5749087.1 hypothetical protein LTS12_020849 [Elasticomyces elasticus]
MKSWSVDVPIEPLSHPISGEGGYQPLEPRSEVLPKGWTGQSSKALPCDILVEHDVAIAVRDGCKLYADIYRPANDDEKVPAIVCWSPFGKKFNGITSLKLMTPWDLGIPDGTLSGLEKFEAPDPADWVPRGYAIINIDSRGAFDSEDVMSIMGSQEAEDGYDLIEHVAKLPWCSGNIGLGGNSHLAIIQWFIAALRPPSLKAIAPWEGCGGIYGGDLFDKLIMKYMLKGRNGVESFRKMFEKHPLANDWWNDKRPDMSKINCPTYITGTWTNTMHGMGAIRGWLEVDTPNKWLRWHPWQEWYDLWGNKQADQELCQFFDHFLRGDDNGWDRVPRVRMAVLKFGETAPIENIVEDDFPIPRTEYRKAYLQSNGSLNFDGPPTKTETVMYNSNEPNEHASFTYTFDKTTQIVGIPKVVLYMSCEDHDDLDVFILLRKLSTSGEPMLSLNIPWKGLPVSSIAEIPEDKRTEVILYSGPTGILRASVRAIDQAKSMHENWPYYPQDKEEKVPPGKIVRLEIGIWATGIEFEAGESIRLQVCGHFQGISNFGTSEHVRNKGTHVLHMGGAYDSHVVLPFV